MFVNAKLMSRFNVFVFQTACFRTKIRNLEPNTDYEIRLWGVSKTRSVFGPTNLTIIRTHQRDYQPLPVVSFNISKWSINGNNCTASIEWTPADGTSFVFTVASSKE